MKPLKIIALSLFSTALFLASCTGEEEQPKTPEEVAAEATADSLEQHQARMKHLADSLERRFPKIGYQRVVIDSKSIYDSIRTTFKKTDANWAAYRAATTLNRKDIYFFRMGDTVVLPDTIVDDLRAYSIFPQFYAGAVNIPKLIMVSTSYQSYACYENGELVRFAATNTGEEGKPTLPGRYAVNWKARKRLSSLDSTWVMPFTVNFHLFAGSAMHQFEMPGRPVSHSCMRQFMADAEWMFHWIDQGRYDKEKRMMVPFTGTPLVILDVFDFNRKKGGPWLELTENKVVVELPADPMAVEEALIPISQIPHVVRGALPNRERYNTAEKVLRERGLIREEARLKESIDHNKRRREKKRSAERKRKADSAAAATNVAPPQPPTNPPVE